MASTGTAVGGRRRFRPARRWCRRQVCDRSGLRIDKACCMTTTVGCLTDACTPVYLPVANRTEGGCSWPGLSFSACPTALRSTSPSSSTPSSSARFVVLRGVFREARGVGVEVDPVASCSRHHLAPPLKHALLFGLVDAGLVSVSSPVFGWTFGVHSYDTT